MFLFKILYDYDFFKIKFYQLQKYKQNSLQKRIFKKINLEIGPIYFKLKYYFFNFKINIQNFSTHNLTILIYLFMIYMLKLYFFLSILGFD